MTGAYVSGVTAFLQQENSDYELYDLDHYEYHSCASQHSPVVCSDCGAVYQKERWTWNRRPEDSCETLCPACLRIQDRVPAGILTVRGDCLKEHKHEILSLIRHTIHRVGKQHPLKRVMDIECDDTEAVFTFTDMHLPREIGDALHQTYDGVLDCEYSSDQSMLRVVWQR
jgi:hypothetical protein